jgi:hypothetical protein
MDVDGKHSRTLELDGDEEALALMDVADLAAAVLRFSDEPGVDTEWTSERVEKAERIIEQIRKMG